MTEGSLVDQELNLANKENEIDVSVVCNIFFLLGLNIEAFLQSLSQCSRLHNVNLSYKPERAVFLLEAHKS